jgi:hypothetical protein
MRTQEERIAKTEALFRNVNERIAEASERFDNGEADEGAFLCECADPGSRRTDRAKARSSS